MAKKTAQERWLARVTKHLRTRDGVEQETQDDGALTLSLVYEGALREVSIPPADTEYSELKLFYADLRDTLTELGIIEGAEYVPPKPSARRAVTPEILAARAKVKKEFEAWQEAWRLIRKAEQSLDVEFEIIQMRDYY